MKNKDYYISKEQLETITHYKRMFEVEAENIYDLCASEKSDIEYGFSLGQTYSHLIDCFSNMTNLEGSIRKQELK